MGLRSLFPPKTTFFNKSSGTNCSTLVEERVGAPRRARAACVAPPGRPAARDPPRGGRTPRCRPRRARRRPGPRYLVGDGFGQCRGPTTTTRDTAGADGSRCVHRAPRAHAGAPWGSAHAGRPPAARRGARKRAERESCASLELFDVRAVALHLHALVHAIRRAIGRVLSQSATYLSRTRRQTLRAQPSVGGV